MEIMCKRQQFDEHDMRAQRLVRLEMICKRQQVAEHDMRAQRLVRLDEAAKQMLRGLDNARRRAAMTRVPF